LRPWVIPAVVLLVLLLVSFVLLLPVLVQQVKLPSFGVGSGVEDVAQPVVLPETYREPTTTYGTPKKDEPPPEAPAPRTQTAPAPGTSPPAPPGLAAFGLPQGGPPQIPTAVLQESPQAPQAPQAPPAPPPPPPRPGQTVPMPAPARATPEKKTWGALAKGKATPTGQPGQGGESASRRAAQEGQDIIHAAKWAIPAQPLKTIYKSMELPGRLRRSINSDLPGIALCELSIPIYDKFNYSNLILDKGSIMVIKQEGKLEYGSTRIPAKLDQIELPSGEVIVAKAIVEDEEGKTGLTGSVNNHIPKLLLSVAINALLSLGTQSLAGTPGRGQFYQDPAQQAAQEVSRSTAQDVRRITEAQLKVPPTVEIAAGTVCLLQLDENVTFSRKAVVVP
jgi:type IV secretory pathway VirB10-like protein